MTTDGPFMTPRPQTYKTSLLIAIASALALGLFGTGSAQTPAPARETTGQIYGRSHQLGGRIGMWSNKGVLPPDSFAFEVTWHT